jgi:hypothetical protein
MSDEREPNENDERRHAPKPPEAPVETPEADPRTEGAPDPEVRSVDSGDAETTQEQIQEGFE